jgi:hypothetical protein
MSAGCYWGRVTTKMYTRLSGPRTALKRPTAPYERKSDRENAARFPPLASQHNPVFRQRDGPDAGPESSQDRSAQRARSYDGRGSPAKPSAARRSWPRWSSTGYSKPIPGKPQAGSLAESWTVSPDGLVLMYDRAIFVPLFEPAFLNGYGPRVVESGLGLITYHGYSAPYEDVKLRAR